MPEKKKSKSELGLAIAAALSLSHPTEVADAELHWEPVTSEAIEKVPQVKVMKTERGEKNLYS